jgi:hypothetical protein
MMSGSRNVSFGATGFGVPEKRLAEYINSLALGSTDGVDITPLSPCIRKKPLQLQLHFATTVWLNPINLGQRYQAFFDAKQVEYGQMFTCLRHYPIISSHYEQAQINPGNPCQHIADEFFMARNIYKAKDS